MHMYTLRSTWSCALRRGLWHTLPPLSFPQMYGQPQRHSPGCEGGEWLASGMDPIQKETEIGKLM